MKRTKLVVAALCCMTIWATPATAQDSTTPGFDSHRQGSIVTDEYLSVGGTFDELRIFPLGWRGIDGSASPPNRVDILRAHRGHDRARPVHPVRHVNV